MENIINTLGNGGFVGLIVLIILWSFFDGKKK